MSSPINDELIKVAAALAGQNPALWDRFVVVMGEHYRKLADDTVKSPPETVQSMQGAARQALTLRDLFATCRDVALKLK